MGVQAPIDLDTTPPTGGATASHGGRVYALAAQPEADVVDFLCGA